MNDDPEMEVRVEIVDGATIITPVGEIDLGRAPALRVQIIAVQAKRPKRMLINLAEVPYMDSSGVATLVEAMQNSRRHGGKLILCAMQDKVRSIFEIARLETVFKIVATTDEGMNA